MPPPKKPKNGPTSVEQFLSQDELKVLVKDSIRTVSAPNGSDDDTSEATAETAVADSGSDNNAPAVVSSPPVSAASEQPLVKSSVVSTSSPTSGRPLSVGNHSPVGRKTPAAGSLLAQAVPTSSSFEYGGDGPSCCDAPSHNTSTTNYLRVPPGLPVLPLNISSCPTSTISSMSPLLSMATLSSAPGTTSVPSSLGSVGGVVDGNHFGSSLEVTKTSGTPKGSILHKLFTSGQSDDGSNAFREQQQQQQQQQQQLQPTNQSQQLWPHGLIPGTIGQPPVFTSDSLLAGLSYRLPPTSSNLVSLVNQSTWLPFEPPRQLTNPSQSTPAHVAGVLRSSSALELQSIQRPAANYSGMQHHQQQQQHLDRRSILATLITSQKLKPVSPDPGLSSPNSDDVFMVKTSSSPRGSSNASSYLSSPLLRQPLSLQTRNVRGGVTRVHHSSSGRTESAPVYLHSAFQLPPSTTTSSIRKNKSTSSLSLLPSTPLVNPALSGIPLLGTKMFPTRTSPTKHLHHAQAPPHLHANENNNNNNNNNDNDLGFSYALGGHTKNGNVNSGDPGGGVGEPYDLSLKTKFLDERSDSKDSVTSSLSGKSPPYATPIRREHSPSESSLTHRSPSTSEGANQGLESDDSNSDINVTSPVPPSSLLRLISDTKHSFPTPTAPISVIESISKTEPMPVSSSLAALLSMSPNAPSSPQLRPTAAVKEEEMETTSSHVPYNMLQCKQEKKTRVLKRFSSACDDSDREPSDCKSPKEEVRMVSPSSCLQALPLGGAGESQTGAAHLQAATSTTPEPVSGPIPHNFLLEMHSHSVGASPSSSHMKQEVVGAVPGSSIQAKLCQVCNDNASGFHYGVWSCEGCKAFFKRSIQGPVDYICPATNTCTIDKHRRKSCQACRLRRCYEVGMNKGSQRKERKSSGNSLSKGKRCRADSTDSTINSTNNGTTSSKAIKRFRSASILEALQRADLPVLESQHNHNHPPTRVHLLNTLLNLINQELHNLIHWARNVPGYTNLTLSDQMHLIRCCWMELLLLNCAFRSMEHEGRKLVFAHDFHLDRQQWAVTGMGAVLEQVSAVSEQMVLYGLNKEELLLLQATVLVNAEVRRLEGFVRIQEMRHMILDVFMEVAGRHQGYGSSRQAPSILLLLTHIRQAGERGITYLQHLKMEGCVVFCDLINEMLETNNTWLTDRRHMQPQQQQQQQQQQHHHLPHPQHLQHPGPPPPPPPPPTSHQQPPPHPSHSQQPHPSAAHHTPSHPQQQPPPSHSMSSD